MNLQQLAELGYVCDLATLGEATTCVECHWDAYPPGTLDALAREIDEWPECEIGFDMLCVHVLGEERCREMDAELDAYFSASHPPCMDA